MFLDDDGRVDVLASDAVWGRRHALAQITYGSAHGRRGASVDVEADPASLARWDAELDEVRRALEPLFAEMERRARSRLAPRTTERGRICCDPSPVLKAATPAGAARDASARCDALPAFGATALRTP